ncbi:hypothetical protein FHS29_007382 [Saccharothrix tamanrassetensis]|uniref:Uncharacterized protein n=1 Tax=Saccharothrix tamanrassetensis TaxID=1051531 RepID=A0A841CWR7_9PSEU|nr:hypothetical protein [Saccharothrix tamanrassetensis]MBB5960754.1 hypothetical protein [Saccharothrix tamanrassetensis]
MFVLLVSVLAMLGVSTASAQAVPEHTRISVPLTVMSVPAGVQPMDTGVGNCGAVWIDLTNNGGGRGTFDYGFQSTLGVVVHRALTVRWANVAVARIHAFDDSGLMLGSRFSNTRQETTTPGRVVSRLVTVIRHVNGVLCLGRVGDTANVT